MSPISPIHPLRILIAQLGGLATVSAATGVSVSTLSMAQNGQRTMPKPLLDKFREIGVDTGRLLADVATWRCDRHREANERLAELASKAGASDV